MSLSRWLCRIKKAYLDGDEGFREAIPIRDWNFWYNECRTYPVPSDPSHRPPRHELPDKCTFKINEKNGSFIRTGECCNCGECCRRISIYRMKNGICRYAYREE